jgi:hypothetical protein
MVHPDSKEFEAFDSHRGNEVRLAWDNDFRPVTGNQARRRSATASGSRTHQMR